MPDPALAAAARAAAYPLQRLGSTWMLHPEQFEATCRPVTSTRWPATSRAGAVCSGDVDSAVVDAVLGIFGPGVTDTYWPMGVRVHGTRGGAALYFRQAAEWGRRRLDAVEGLGRFIALAEKVIATAPTTSMPLLAAQARLPRVHDEPGRAMQVPLLLRELRFGLHSAAMLAAGLPMMEAHLLNQGEEYAAMLGVPGPYPPVEHLKARKAAVEDATDAPEAEVWAMALTPAEAAELAELAGRLYDRVRDQDPIRRGPAS